MSFNKEAVVASKWAVFSAAAPTGTFQNLVTIADTETSVSAALEQVVKCAEISVTCNVDMDVSYNGDGVTGQFITIAAGATFTLPVSDAFSKLYIRSSGAGTLTGKVLGH